MTGKMTDVVTHQGDVMEVLTAPDDFHCSYCGEDTTECRQAARHGGPCGA